MGGTCSLKKRAGHCKSETLWTAPSGTLLPCCRCLCPNRCLQLSWPAPCDHNAQLPAARCREVAAAAFPPPAAVIFLPFSDQFVGFWHGADAQLWSFSGERLATLQGAALSAAASMGTIYVTNPQDLLFFWCPPGEPSQAATGDGGGSAAATEPGRPAPAAGEGAQAAAAGPHAGDAAGGAQMGCVRIYDLLHGRQVAAVQQRAQPVLGPSSGGHGKLDLRAERRAAAAAAALKHVTALFYCEASHRLYTGTADGRVQAWAVG